MESTFFNLNTSHSATLTLLLKPVWDYKDIMAWTKVKSKTTALQIKKKAQKQFNGYVPYGTQYVKSDSVLAIYGTSRETELNLLKKGGIDEETLQKGNI